MKDVTNAMSFLVSILTISLWLLARRLFYGLSRIGERLVPKNGFEMKKPAILVLNAVINFSEGLQNVISAKWNWIWTNFLLARQKLFHLHLSKIRIKADGKGWRFAAAFEGSYCLP